MEEFPYEDETWKITRNAFNLSLREGWNTIYLKGAIEENWTDDHYNFTETVNFELKNPDIIWSINITEYHDDEYDSRKLIQNLKSRWLSVR